jgi:hypothetical protein
MEVISQKGTACAAEGASTFINARLGLTCRNHYWVRDPVGTTVSSAE